MEYEEQYAWNLTSGSTCYTGVRRVERNLTAGFATEWHVCLLQLTKDASTAPGLSWREITPNSDDSLVCVGFSISEHFECLALIDTSKLVPISSPRQTVETSTTVRDPDDQSVSASTVAYSRTTVDSANMHDAQRWISLDSSSVNFTSSSHNTSSPGNSNFLSNPVLPEREYYSIEASEQIALLVLRKQNVHDASTTTEFSVALDFRPLAPTICALRCMDAEETPAIILFGSADNNKLHWYEADSISLSLRPRSIESEAFLFSSPVMAIDFKVLNEQQLNILAVSCQDGTLRTILFRYTEPGDLIDIRYSQVIVDGPLVCTCVQVIDDGWIQVTSGSLYGYVTELEVNSHTGQSRGPYMVAEGFWNAAVRAEDSVLVVHALKDYVLVGTQSGCVLVFQKMVSAGMGNRRDYCLAWQCKLPYPIYSLCTICDESKILVTTRRSVHIFQRARSLDYKTEAESIKTKVLRLLQASQVYPAKGDTTDLDKSIAADHVHT